MTTLELTKEQLHLVQQALELYLRIGIGQLEEVLKHPTFERNLENYFRPPKDPEVGDSTPQGKVLDIKEGKALIAGSVKDGMWNEEHEWKDLKDVVLSPSYDELHDYQEDIVKDLNKIKEKLYADGVQRHNYYSSWGIHHSKVDPSCRMAYDIIQVIRHEFWKQNPNRSEYTVDSGSFFTYEVDNSSHKIKCKV